MAWNYVGKSTREGIVTGVVPDGARVSLVDRTGSQRISIRDSVFAARFDRDTKRLALVDRAGRVRTHPRLDPQLGG